MELASSANKMGLTKILTRSNGGNAFSASIPFRVPATATSDAASSNADITGTALMTVTIPETTAAADKLWQRLRGTPFFDKSQELQSELYARTQDELDALGSEVKVHLPSFSSAAFVLLSDDAHKASAARSLLVGTDLSNCRYGTERWNKRALKQTMGAADRQSLSDSYGKPVSSKTMQEPVILEADDDLQSMAWNSTKETLQPEMSMQAGGLLLATDEHRIGDLYCRPLYASDDGNATQVPLDAYARLTKVYLPQSREDRVAMDAALRRPSDCSFPDLQAHHDERLKGTAATSRGSSKVFRGPVRWEKPGVKVTTLGPAVSVSTHPGDLRFTRISEDGSFQKLFSCVRPVELVSAEKQQDGSALEVKTRGMAHYDVGVKGEVTTIE